MCAFVAMEDFNELFRNKSEEYRETILVFNNRRASRKVVDLLAYEPVYRHVIPYKPDELGRIRLLALRIGGQAPRLTDFSLEDFRAKLEKNALLV